MAAAAEEIRRRDPDVVLLQEVWFAEDAALLRRHLEPAYVAVDTVPGWLGRKGGLLSFVNAKRGWAVVGSRFEQFEREASAWLFWEGDGIGDKGMQLLDLRSGTGQRLLVINTHLQAEYRVVRYEEVRRSQLRQLARAARGTSPSLPVVAAGDLNTRPEETSLFHEISGEWFDLTAGAREDCRCGTLAARDEGGETGRWIDYVLTLRRTGWQATAEISQIRSERADEPFSDHHGIDATVRLEPGADALSATRLLAAAVIRGPSTRRQWLLACGALVWGR
jgi:endonuclease/exonuclease/phosphatase family metal-dependent hydrolase